MFIRTTKNRSNGKITDIGFKTCTKEDYSRTKQTIKYYEDVEIYSPFLCLNNTDELYLLSDSNNHKTQKAYLHI